MERAKKTTDKFLFPSNVFKVLLTLLSASVLVYIFLWGNQFSPVAYMGYVVSAYTLIIMVVGIPSVIKSGKLLVYNNPFGSRFLTEVNYRAMLFMYSGMAINLLYVLFNVVTCFIYHSIWYGAVAIYYMVLSLIYFVLIRKSRKIFSQEQGVGRQIQELYSYRLCGFLLFLLNLTMTGIVFQIIWQDKSYVYVGLVIYGAAGFTFCRLFIVIVNMVKFRKKNSPILTAVKMMNFVSALMSLFVLQTAMFAEFGGGDIFRRVMNALTGAIICFIVIYMAAYMVLQANKKLKTIMINSSKT
ncbi:hypothetical protein [Planomicrobium sp. CPCC 101110]|uniref:hypothetical protein n=1 Tax=Planomicrobium sp. CPCC 101110 TaxID=2599619 RepID=UPI0011B52665|nr:hypothetical protein [Planomicrobium sp. CPCC 101110]TWT25756.1 hypothetical protein FQV30_08095 [Planomicrobium sp. CPCC 101110]